VKGEIKESKEKEENVLLLR